VPTWERSDTNCKGVQRRLSLDEQNLSAYGDAAAVPCTQLAHGMQCAHAASRARQDAENTIDSVDTPDPGDARPAFCGASRRNEEVADIASPPSSLTLRSRHKHEFCAPTRRGGA
jgi:hypothetical protein